MDENKDEYLFECEIEGKLAECEDLIRREILSVAFTIGVLVKAVHGTRQAHSPEFQKYLESLIIKLHQLAVLGGERYIQALIPNTTRR